MNFFKRWIKFFILQTLFWFNKNQYVRKKEILHLKTILFLSKANIKKYQFLEKRNPSLLVFEFTQEIFENDFVSAGVKHYYFNNLEKPQSNADVYFFDRITIKSLTDCSHQFFPNFIIISFLELALNIKDVINILKFRKYFFRTFKVINNRVFVIFEKRNKTLFNSTRKYIPYKFSRVSFLEKLKDIGVNSVVLRWFDNLKELGDLEEDIDILVDDESLSLVFSILESDVGVLPIDVYSVDGISGSDYLGLPYFPNRLSTNILKNKKLFNNSFYVPNENDYFLSIVYHIAIHKGVNSGLAIDDKIPNKNKVTDHDYKNVLMNLWTNKLTKEVDDINLRELYKILDKNDIEPSYDLILKLYHQRNKDYWYKTIIQTFQKRINQNYKFVNGLTVFIIREKAYSEANIQRCTKIFHQFGFDILKQEVLSKSVINTLKYSIRGGNWGKGPFKVSGGPPKCYFVVYDSFFSKPTLNIKKQYPNLENEKVLKAKLELRNALLNKDLNEDFNAVHSSDDFFESIYYLEQFGFIKEEIEEVIDNCISINDLYTTNHKVVKNLSRHSRRAKVEVIEFNGGLAIKKTFKNNKLNYLKREKWLMNVLKEVKEVPKLLESGSNYFISEYFEDSRSFNDEKLDFSIDLILKFKAIIECLYDRNITLIDLNPSNVLLYKGNIKIIDFEFAQKYENKPKEVKMAYEISNTPINFKGDLPIGHQLIKDNYEQFWLPKFKLTKNQLFSTNNRILLYFFIKINMLKHWLK